MEVKCAQKFDTISTKNTKKEMEIKEEEETEEFPVEFHGDRYEIGEFLKYHPGGYNYVEAFKNKDVRMRMKQTDHSESAFYLLREYKINGRDEKQHSEPRSEDLEYLVDWSKPMLSQVGHLGAKYNEWVRLPVDRELILFANPLLENLTKTPWYIVPLVWLPITLYFLHIGYATLINHTSEQTSGPLVSGVEAALAIAFGVALWTLLEYSCHRWIFHSMPSGKYKAAIVFHFLLHGLHHKVPFDHYRLVFPPFPAAIVTYATYKLYQIIVPEKYLFLVAAGSILGYLIYDMIHFYLHYGVPKEGTYLYDMKRYHNQHHFVHQDSGFGISNHSWDHFFGTLIKLKKLGMGIKWR